MAIDLRGVGYLVLESADVAGWRALTVDVMGLMAGDGPPRPPDAPGDGTLWLRVDDRSWRIAVQPAEREGLAAVGWELPSARAFDAAIAHLDAHHVAWKDPGGAAVAGRGVQALVELDDPFGNRHELFWGPTTEEASPFRSPAGTTEFLTDGVGLGHVLYVVPSCAEAEAWYGDVLGLRLTDRFAWGPNGGVFMRCTRRHHSLAFIDLPIHGPGLNHFMLEVTRIDDLGRAYERAMDAGIEIVNSLGQHSNDPMLSFYVRSPSGFNVELGWQGLMVDDASWTVKTWTGRGELWGHRGAFMDDVATAKAE
jgi:3,4-dihydroxy-9,10-secoandrosta-1,3,5(10)-triene-9,17-dione 4,5-dioxygenase